MRLAAINVGTMLTLLMIAGQPSSEEQECGTNVHGGTIPQGNYSGSGTSCSAAYLDLCRDMGIQGPECADCPNAEQRGCKSAASFTDASDILIGRCIRDDSTGLYAQLAIVNEGGGSTWDKVCTSCYVPPDPPQ